MYEFRGGTGDAISLDLRPFPDADIGTHVSLWNDAGVKLAEAQYSSDDPDAQIGYYVIPKNGMYSISVSNLKEGSGRYQLELFAWDADSSVVQLDSSTAPAGVKVSGYTNAHRFAGLPAEDIVEVIEVSLDPNRGSLRNGMKICMPASDEGVARIGYFAFLDESRNPPTLEPMYSWYEAHAAVCVGVNKPGKILRLNLFSQAAGIQFADVHNDKLKNLAFNEALRRTTQVIAGALIDKFSGKVAEKASKFGGNMVHKFGGKLSKHVTNRFGKQILGEGGESVVRRIHEEALTKLGLHDAAFQQMHTILVNQHDEIFASQYQAIVGEYVGELGEEAGQRAANTAALESTEEFIERTAQAWADGAFEETVEQFTQQTIQDASVLAIEVAVEDGVETVTRGTLNAAGDKIVEETLDSPEGLQDAIGTVEDSANQLTEVSTQVIDAPLIEVAVDDSVETGIESLSSLSASIAEDFLNTEEGLQVTMSVGNLIEESAAEVLGDFGGQVVAFVADATVEIALGPLSALFKSGVFAFDAFSGLAADAGLNTKLYGCHVTTKALTRTRLTPKGFSLSFLPPNAILEATARTSDWFKVRLLLAYEDYGQWLQADSVWTSGDCG